MAYAKHTWQTGETITATKLNNIENGIATNDEAIGDVPEQIDAIQEELEMKANIDGAYESMTVGNAEQLVSTQFVEDNAPYVFRTSGGSADIGNREEDTIVGGTVAWNQIVTIPQNSRTSTSQGVTSTDNRDGTFTLNGTATGRGNVTSSNNLEVPIGHVFLVKGYKAPDGTPSSSSYLGFGGNNIDKGVGGIWKNTSEYSQLTLRVDFVEGVVYNNLTIAPQAFDLTQMFGSAVADAVYAMEQANAGSGVAWFKAMYPLDYYAYNAGELKSVEGLASHDMVGFNQFDGVLEIGDISTSDGTNSADTTKCRSKNYIPCLPQTTYFYHSDTIWASFRFYDADKNFLGTETNQGVNKNVTFETPQNARYMRFVQTTTTFTDICINLSWSGTRNGEYEPYVKHSYPLDSSLTLRGIPKVDADGQMYYDGDTYEADGTVTRKYGIVDLGTLNWEYSNSCMVSNTLPVSGSVGDIGSSNNVICSKYPARPTRNYTTSYDNNLCGLTIGGTQVIVRDDNYTSPSDFKTAMSGVYLVYELATPTTEPAEPYTTPQVVEDWGTEEYVTTGIVAVGHNTKYPQNLRDKLQHLPVLAEDDGAYMIQQTGTQMHLVNFRIPKAENLADGTYVLKATVSGGTPTYTWEAE